MKKYLSYLEAQSFVQSLGLCSRSEWRDYCKSGQKPENIPADPSKFYQEWFTWGAFLGTNDIYTLHGKYLSFGKARKFVSALNFSTRNEWFEYCKSGKKPANIPNRPFPGQQTDKLVVPVYYWGHLGSYDIYTENPGKTFEPYEFNSLGLYERVAKEELKYIHYTESDCVKALLKDAKIRLCETEKEIQELEKMLCDSAN